MIELRKTPEFAKWLHELRDIDAFGRIEARIKRLEEGNPGDHKAVGKGLMEMRIHSGPGYRVYFTRRGRQVVILLAGGDKESQAADIKKAAWLAHNF